MKDLVLISIPESTISNIVEKAVRKAISEYQNNEYSEKPFFTFDEFLEYSGLSESHVYKLTSRKEIPHYKRGRKIYFDKSEIDNWLLSKKIATVQDRVEDMNNYLQNAKSK